MAFRCGSRVLGTGDTFLFRGPLCCQRSWRLFLGETFLITSKQAFANDDAGISIGVAAHLAIWAEHQGSTGRISFRWLSRVIAGNRRTTAGTVMTGIPGIDSAGHDSLIPGFVFAVLEDLPS